MASVSLLRCYSWLYSKEGNAKVLGFVLAGAGIGNILCVSCIGFCSYKIFLRYENYCFTEERE